MKKKVLKGKELSKSLDLEEKVKECPPSSGVDLLPDDGAGILNKKVLDAKERARVIIEGAEKESERIRNEAKEILSQVRSKMDDEKRRGFDEGREEGLASVTEYIAAFEKMKEEFYGSAEENIINLVMMVSEKVIGKIVHEHASTIKSIVSQALESAIGEKIVVRLSPEDYKVVTAASGEFHDQLDKTKRISFKADESITSGGCVVETEVGTIDARLETQLNAIRKAFEL